MDVTEPGAPELPDLALTTSDLSVVSDEPAGTVTLSALVHNRGSVPASNVEVAFYELGTLLGTTVLEEIAGDGTGGTSLTVSMTIAGDHMFRVVVDPAGSIAEGDETNNEASLVVQWNTPPSMEGHILVTGSLPSTVYASSLFAVAGQAVYDLYIDGVRNTDYVVKGGSVEVTVKADAGTEWLYGGIYTDVNGDFRKYLVAPSSPGIYRILMKVSDQTFVGTRELVVTVLEAPSEPPPPPPPPTRTGEGDWSYDGASGEWTWVWIILPVGEPILESDLAVFSEDLYFSVTHPDAGEEITVFAELHYWALSTSLLAEDIPVNFYATYPGTAREQIGQTIIPSLSVGAPDHGSRYVYATWRNAGDGIYIVEVEVDPSYAEDNLLNNAATRAIVVGEVASGQGVIAGQVTDAWGGVDDVIVSVFEGDGTPFASTVTDATGYYLVGSVPMGEMEVRIEVPTGYVADADAKTVSVDDQSVSNLDFYLTTICAVPQPPTGLKVAITRNYALLRWNASEDAEGYIMYRRVDNQDEFLEIGTSTVTTFRDRDYAIGDDFNLLEYYVVAQNDCGASEPSAVVTVKPKGRK
ncbi:MAG: CARDB domain-containing protein [Pseudomonadota bacterium]|nr:CARDB domain-containing protein [Pseudomonadota bacterium]